MEEDIKALEAEVASIKPKIGYGAIRSQPTFPIPHFHPYQQPRPPQQQPPPPPGPVTITPLTTLNRPTIVNPIALQQMKQVAAIQKAHARTLMSARNQAQKAAEIARANEQRKKQDNNNNNNNNTSNNNDNKNKSNNVSTSIKSTSKSSTKQNNNNKNKSISNNNSSKSQSNNNNNNNNTTSIVGPSLLTYQKYKNDIKNHSNNNNDDKHITIPNSSLRNHLHPILGTRNLYSNLSLLGDIDNQNNKPKKKRKIKATHQYQLRNAANETWIDPTMTDWPENDFRIFCGDLGNEVSDAMLTSAFSKYPSFAKAKVIRDKRTGKSKGYGFISFLEPNDFIRAFKEMNNKYVGNRPIKLRRSKWKERMKKVKNFRVRE